MAHSSLRFGIGRFTTEDEIDYVVKEIVGTVNKLRDMRLVILPEVVRFIAYIYLVQSTVGDGTGRYRY